MKKHLRKCTKQPRDLIKHQRYFVKHLPTFLPLLRKWPRVAAIFCKMQP